MSDRALAALIDAVVSPAPPLPPVRDTDAVAALRRWLAAGTPPQRTLLRAAAIVLGTRPALLRARALRPLADGLRAGASSAYYGDLGVLRVLGHDPEAIVRERRAAREAACA
jgi:hypothetical protein